MPPRHRRSRMGHGELKKRAARRKGAEPPSGCMVPPWRHCHTPRWHRLGGLAGPCGLVDRRHLPSGWNPHDRHRWTCLAQKDGGLPTTVGRRQRPGESGVSILSVRFMAAPISMRRRDSTSSGFRYRRRCAFDCRIAGRRFGTSRAGSLAICPAGSRRAADAEESLERLLVAIDPRHLALAAAEESALEAQLIERFRAATERSFVLARILAAGERRRLSQRTAVLERGGERLHRQSGCPPHVGSPNTGHGACWAKTCSSGSGTMSSPISTSRSRSPRWPT